MSVHDADLNRRNPGWAGTAKVLAEYTHETLHEPEWRTVEHHDAIRSPLRGRSNRYARAAKSQPERFLVAIPSLILKFA